MKAMIAFISLWLGAFVSCAQPATQQVVNLQRLTDEMLAAPDTDADADYEDLYENLAQILASPYNLNKVSRAELRSLCILTDSQIENLLAYRVAQGAFLDVHELQVIPGFDLTTIASLAPFVKVVDVRAGINPSLVKRIFSGGHSYFVGRQARTLETKKGFRPDSGNVVPYAGSPDQLYWRMRSFIPGDFSIGITGEKDAGEEMRFDFRDAQWWFDFTSFHFQLQNKGPVKNVIVGDFQTQFGQGLLLGGAFGLGKGSESVSTARKSNLGFLPYTAINESAYHRGVALSLRVKNLRIASFFSRVRRDASSADDAERASVTAFQQSGYHRTRGEIQKRKAVGEQDIGLVVHYAKNRFDAGVIAHAIRFDKRVEKKPTLYNQHAFRGKGNLNAGIFANYNLQNLSFFTEIGHSFTGGSAALAGLLFSPHQKLDIALLYRNYAPDFHTFYANAFSENTQPQNEQGVYWGWKYRWNRQYSFSGFVDLFEFPWLAFRRYAPSQGYEWLMRANYQPSRQVAMFVSVREARKDRNVPLPASSTYQPVPGKKRNLTASCDYGIGEKIRLKTRAQFSQYDFDGKTTKGIALLQDLSFSIGRFTFTGRHALFDSDDYDNRSYVYEHDAWLAYSFPSYAGVGVRNYALFEFQVHKQLTLWLRYARTALAKGEEIGSGNDVIQGNTRNDIKFQARFKF